MLFTHLHSRTHARTHTHTHTHTHTRVQPVGHALIFALQQACGNAFTDEVKEAWITLYGVVQYYMTVGMNEGLDA